MRVAIALDDDFVSAHFGRCQAFLIVDIDKEGNILRQEKLENPGYVNHQPGLVPRFLQSIGVDYIIAGGMGPKAIMMLQSVGIQPILGVTGRVEDVLKAFIEGSLKGGESLCDHSYDRECH